MATKEYADRRKHIIAVYTSYYGDLIKGDYQFTFGGSACKKAGFLMPHPGRIKKIKIRMAGTLFFDYEGVRGMPLEEAYFDVFTIMLFNKDEFLDLNQNFEGSILGTYEYSVLESAYENVPVFIYSLKNHSLSEGDYINVRSERTVKNKTDFSFLFTF